MILTTKDGNIEIHVSHLIERDGLMVSCRYCRLCVCHASSALALTCEHSHGEPDETPVNVVTAITKQAYRYGEQIRLLEDAKMEDARARVRRAWQSFRNQFGVDTYLRKIAREAYYEAYCQ